MRLRSLLVALPLSIAALAGCSTSNGPTDQAAAFCADLAAIESCGEAAVEPCNAAVQAEGEANPDCRPWRNDVFACVREGGVTCTAPGQATSGDGALSVNVGDATIQMDSGCAPALADWTTCLTEGPDAVRPDAGGGDAPDTGIILPDTGRRDTGRTDTSELCSGDGDCPTDLRCVDGACVPRDIEPECTSSGQCGLGLICVDGVCVVDNTPECTSSGQCGLGLICVDGVCVVDNTPECAVYTDCDPDQLCRNERCVDASGALCEDGECRPGWLCFDGACREDVEPVCFDDEGCDPGFECRDGQCVGTVEPECQFEWECSDGFLCLEGVCVEIGEPECFDDGDCGLGRICSDGVCIREQAECFSDAECGTNGACRDGACYTTVRDACCGATDTCSWGGDGYCDCDGLTTWDRTDCEDPQTCERQNDECIGTGSLFTCIDGLNFTRTCDNYCLGEGACATTGCANGACTCVPCGFTP